MKQIIAALIVGLAIGGAAGWLSKPAERITERVTETVTKTVTAAVTPTPTPTPSITSLITEEKWETCRFYTIVFEINVDFGESMRIAEVKAYLKNVETFDLEIKEMNITLGVEIESLSIIVAVDVHPRKDIVAVGFCETFNLKIDVEMDVKYVQEGREKVRSYTIQSPPYSVTVCG